MTSKVRLRELARGVQALVPGLHVGYLAECPAGLLDLHDVGGLVVARGVVGEFGGAEAHHQLAANEASGRIVARHSNSVPLKPVLVFRL